MKKGEATIDDVFANFENIDGSLKTLGIELLDDKWFTENETNKDTINLKDHLKYKFQKLRNRKKEDAAAIHDSLMLRWVHKNSFDGKKTRFITLDTSLTGPMPDLESNQSIAISLDALLQHLAPFTSDQDEFQVVFGNLLKTKLLPDEKIFDMRDFLIFHQLNVQTKILPIEDVEGCILHLKNSIGSTDINDPRVREAVNYEMSKYFVDPSRSYQKELGRLQDEIIRNEALNVNASEKTKQDYEKRLLEKDDLMTNEKAISEKRFHELEVIKNESDERFKLEQLVTSGQKRMLGMFIFLILFYLLFWHFAAELSKGDNWYQKLIESKEVIGFIFFVWVIASYLIIGKERLMALGWPWNKIFKISETE